MITSTETTVYHIKSPNSGEPTVLFQAENIRALASGEYYDAAALGDGTICVISNADKRHSFGRINEPVESLLILDEDPLRLLAGTEDAHLYLIDRNNTVRVSTFDELECRNSWHTPWGGPPSVRSLAVTADGWIYADIHVGSIMRSPDRGSTWQPVNNQVDEDVHQVTTCRSEADCVYANTARGVYVSDDRGQSWQHRAADLGDRYGRAIAVAPDNPDLLLATVSDGPHGDNVHGQLYRSEDRGLTWRHIQESFPKSVAENINTHHVVFDSSGFAWVIIGRTLYIGTEAATTWRSFWEAPEPLQLLAVSNK